jgi:inosose dehydratase
MHTIQVGNAPCSWGTLEFEGLETNPIGYRQMLDELVETGYTATELGDWGFMPTEPQALRRELEDRRLAMLGAYVQVAFKNPDAHRPGREEVLKVARLLAASANSPAPAGHKPYLILADDNAGDPERTRVAGRVTAPVSVQVGLDSAGWRTFARGVMEIAHAVREETGLPTLFHHHCAGYVETPTEIQRLLDNTDPALVNLVFDTGHYVFGTAGEGGAGEGGSDGASGADGNLVPVLERNASRIAYIHFKDCEPQVAARSRQEGWDYLTSLRRGVFCELGKGSVDFPGVVDWLRRGGYQGWVLVEQDVLPGMGTPRESARRNRDYLRSIGL